MASLTSTALRQSVPDGSPSPETALTDKAELSASLGYGNATHKASFSLRLRTMRAMPARLEAAAQCQ